MRLIRYIDLAGQTLLMIGGLGCFASALLDPRDGILAWAMLFQAFLGAWQMIGCVISVFRSKNERERKITHLIFSSIYLATLFGIVIVKSAMINGEGFWVFLIGLPWVLAIYYYLTTWRIAVPRYNSYTDFLPYLDLENTK